MSTYRLYKSPEGDIVRVKIGFSWRAFFVGSMAAMIRRTWLLFVVAALYYASEAYFYGVPTPTSRIAGVALAALGFYAVYGVDLSARYLIPTEDTLRQVNPYDRYAFIRNAWLQRREYLIHGTTPKSDEDTEQELLKELNEDDSSSSPPPSPPK